MAIPTATTATPRNTVHMIKRIDFHAHILPGADHGCENVTMSLQQLALAKKAGVNTVVATPHFYPRQDNLYDFLTRREEAVHQLCTHWQERRPRVALGAEVHLCVGLERMEGLDCLCVGGTNVLLLELPFRYWNDEIFNTVLEIAHGGQYTPVLAHVDRYLPEVIEMLFSEGIRGQLNAESVCGLLRRRRLRRWAEEGNIVALGSDIHGLGNAYDKLRKAERLLGETYDSIMQATNTLLEKAEYL